jgi:subtilisin-like proprotein convertase family protein
MVDAVDGDFGNLSSTKGDWIMTLPQDTLFAQQWHLYNTTAGQYDLDVVKVWDDYTGKGIKVFVIDSGIDFQNPDLAPNYDQLLDHDFASGDDDASPADAFDNHGTSVAGIIGGARNGTGVVGVAYDATLVGYRAGSDGFAFSAITAALTAALAADAPIVNMSLGVVDSYYPVTSATIGANAAIDNLTKTGRDGLGAIVVKAAGNERGHTYIHDLNAYGFGSDTHAINVAAINQDGFVSSYSTPGAPILISAFGSEGSVVTTDRIGADGYNTDADDPGITKTFDGTSAATPMISGVAALMLQANPDLGWRDVQTILADTARHVGSAIGATAVSGVELFLWSFNKATNWNGGGMHYSADYGFGLVDALAAVRLAETWTQQSTSANEASADVSVLGISPVDLVNGDAAGKSFSADVSQAMTVERAAVTMTFSGLLTADLYVYLTGPDGQEYKLIGGIREPYDEITQATYTYTFETQQMRGESGTGTWTVRTADGVNNSGTLSVSNISVHLYGAASASNDTYVYTNEFSDYAGIGGHSKTLKDTDGGVDTLNASAVIASMTVDLTARAAKIDGVAMTIIAVENVYAGSGSDHITGNKVANILSGGRGKDYLAGGAGADTFLYHIAKDSLAGSGHDIISDFSSVDRIDLSDIDTASRAGDQAFRFIGTRAFSGVSGQLDFIEVNKRGTAHDWTYIRADLDGDKHADFEIALNGLHALTKGDFLL